MIVITDELLRQAAQAYIEVHLASLPDPSECNHVFSEEYERKKRKLIRTYKYFGLYNGLKKVAVFFIAFMLSAAMLLAFHPEARAAVFGWIEDRVGEFYHFFYVDKETPLETESVDATGGTGVTEESAGTVDEGNLPSYSLGWVPEGYSLITVMDREGGKTLVYSNQDTDIIQFVFAYGSDAYPDAYPLYMGYGEYQKEHVSEEGFQADIFFALDEFNANGIVWKSDEGDVILSISSHASKEDLIRMAQNVVVEEAS